MCRRSGKEQCCLHASAVGIGSRHVAVGDKGPVKDGFGEALTCNILEHPVARLDLEDRISVLGVADLRQIWLAAVLVSAGVALIGLGPVVESVQHLALEERNSDAAVEVADAAVGGKLEAQGAERLRAVEPLLAAGGVKERVVGERPGVPPFRRGSPVELQRWPSPVQLEGEIKLPILARRDERSRGRTDGAQQLRVPAHERSDGSFIRRDASHRRSELGTGPLWAENEHAEALHGSNGREERSDIHDVSHLAYPSAGDELLPDITLRRIKG